MIRLLLVLVLATVATPQDFGRQFGLPLLVRVASAPVPVRADGKYVLVYELHVTTDSKPVDLRRLEVLGPDRLAVLEGAKLAGSIWHSNDPGRVTTTIGAGNHAVIWMFVLSEQRPAAIRHRITGIVGDDKEPLTLEAGHTKPTGKPVRLLAPLKGDRWVSFEGLGNENHHRRGWFATGDRAIVPQRFAIDFVRAFNNGEISKGDSRVNANYACHGAEVLAVASARVAHVTDGLPERIPGDKDPGYELTMENAAGNSVVLDLGKGRYALYGHLQPGVRVKVGDRVKAGQILGLVGNSGASPYPHLHFGVSDGPTLLTGDGLPYEFDFYHDNRLHRNEIPLEDWLLNFR
jgi:hypothetical protein